MKLIETRREIAAPADTVWSVLVDPAALVAADTGITRIEGAIVAGSMFALWSDVAPGRRFAISVRAYEPPTCMVWRSGLPLGLFRGERTFRLSETNGWTLFHMKEVFSGLVLPLIWRSMPNLQDSFDRFAAAVARVAESRSA